jgi:hypothetical protein
MFQRPIAAAITMWNFSFSLYLPVPLYALALGSYVYTMLVLWAEGGASRRRAAGLLLIAVAGLKLDYTYYVLLALLGFVLLLETEQAVRAWVKQEGEEAFTERRKAVAVSPTVRTSGSSSYILTLLPTWRR